MSNIRIACDPGMKGGLAIIEDGRIKALHKMPVFTLEVVKNGKKGKQNHIDVPKLYDILSPYFTGTNEPQVYVEELTHLYGFPSSSNFKLGYACGAIHSVLQLLGSFYLIHQKKWQQIWEKEDIEYEIDKATGKVKMAKRGKSLTPKINTKLTSLNCAKRLYPGEDFLHEGGRKVHDGCIDAILIATYGGNQ